jgi:predicted TIM-barrel fold metal-dependent hydrolase
MTPTPGGHAGLANRWGGLTIAEQLAHVGSEVERALRAQESGNAGRRDHAVDRALELFDLTAADPRWRGARRREILRAREDFCGWLLAEQASPAARLRRYFLAFAVLARRTTTGNGPASE